MRITRFIAPTAALLFGSVVNAQIRPTQPPVTTPPVTQPPITKPQARPGTTIAPATPMTTTPPAPIFRMTDVSRAMTLNDRQLSQLNAMTQRLQNTYQAQYDRLNSLPATQRTNRLMELNRQYTNAWLGGAKDVLTPTQLNRYQQLQLQYGGYSTFNDPAIQKGLNLTDTQIAQLNKALLASNTQMQTIMKLAQTDPVRARQSYADFYKAYQNQLTKVLTPAQQQQWSQMTGEPFPFPPPFGTGGTVPPKQ